LHQAKPALKQPNLNKLGDASGCKVSGKLTQGEPIFESRAVYTQQLEKSVFGLSESSL
jgi:hypothetical protein